ncbi:MAG: CYTH domain-containing protein [Lachnospiraceae bacterium]|nr:CYTH domain-containing protein [Lachnospiraceae bacterium]
MEIERKYLIDRPECLPENYKAFPSHPIEQGYLCTSPVVRVRKSDDEYYLTYKGKGLLAREEYNLPLTKEAYEHLIQKADGIVLTKRRYLIPLAGQYPASDPAASSDLMIELDIFEGVYAGLILAEVEFPSLEEAERFTPPAWFGRDVTFSGEYQNSKLSAGR